MGSIIYIDIESNNSNLNSLTMDLYDANGKLILTARNSNKYGYSFTQLYTSSLAKGIYYLRINSNLGAEVKKLVKL